MGFLVFFWRPLVVARPEGRGGVRGATSAFVCSVQRVRGGAADADLGREAANGQTLSTAY